MSTIITIGKKALAIILDIIIWGLGHGVIGKIKRGVGIFLLGFAIMFAASFFIPFPYSLLVGLAYLIWLISDLIKIINSVNKHTSISTDPNSVYGKGKYCGKCGSPNVEGSSFSTKCGSELK